MYMHRVVPRPVQGVARSGAGLVREQDLYAMSYYIMLYYVVSYIYIYIYIYNNMYYNSNDK